MKNQIFDLSKEGGCIRTDENTEYNLWDPTEKNSDLNECFPDRESAKENFKDIFTKHMNSFLSIYKAVNLPLDNYLLVIDRGNLLGISIESLKLPVVGKKTESFGFYERKADFIVDLDGYDFSGYNELRKHVADLVGTCKNKHPNECAEEKFSDIPEFDLIKTCESPEKETFFEFVDYLESCANSEIPNKEESQGCPCRGPPEEGSYNLKQQGNNIEIIGNVNGKKFQREIENINIVGEPNEIKNNLILHRVSDGLLIEKDFNPTNPSCNLKPKTKFRFCVQSNKNKFYAYDEDDGKTILRPVVYKFALDFGENLKPQTTEQIDEGQPSDLVQIDRGLIACDGSCQLQKEAYEQLKLANQKARDSGFGIYVYSSYRSLEKQKELWESYASKYPDEDERRIYVCYPYGEDPYTRCPHLTGKAIDVRIEGKSSNTEMTEEDWENLAEVMYSNVWVRYTPEKWHFEYGTTRWARAQEANVNAIV